MYMVEWPATQHQLMLFILSRQTKPVRHFHAMQLFPCSHIVKENQSLEYRILKNIKICTDSWLNLGFFQNGIVRSTLDKRIQHDLCAPASCVFATYLMCCVTP